MIHNHKIDLTFEQKIILSLDAARGLHFLHTRNPPLIYGNVASENFLVTEKLRVKLSDFFLTVKPFADSVTNIKDKLKYISSTFYMRFSEKV